MSTAPNPDAHYTPGRPPSNTARNIAIGVVLLAVAGGLGYYFLSGPRTVANTDGKFPGKIKVGHLVALDMAPMFVAKEAGYFQEEGLDVETVFFANPGDNNAALSGGSIQFSINPFTLHYLAANGGVPIRVISSAGGVAIMQVVAQAEYKIDGLPALAAWVKANPGKKLRVAALRGDTLEMIVYRGFAEVGLSYDNFEMVWIDDLVGMVEQFRSKQVDILSHIKPYTTEAISEGRATAITDNDAIWGKGTPNCTTAVLAEFYDKYPNTVKGYHRALYKGFDLCVKDPEKAAALLEKGKYYKVSKETLLFALKNQPKEVVLLPNEEGVGRCIDDLAKLGYIKKTDKKIFYLEPLNEVLGDMKGK